MDKLVLFTAGVLFRELDTDTDSEELVQLSLTVVDEGFFELREGEAAVNKVSAASVNLRILSYKSSIMIVKSITDLTVNLQIYLL